jgi:hypothetical protein
MRKDERGETGKGRTTRESLPPTDRKGTTARKKNTPRRRYVELDVK